MNSTNEQERIELEQKIKSMRLMGDYFMAAVLSDKACAELVVKIIRDRDDISVKDARIQRPINEPDSVLLDVFAEDSESEKYDIKILCSEQKITPKHARYICSMIVLSTLLSGENPDEQTETYVIIVTGNDVFQCNKPLYTIRRTINETSGRFGDGSYIIYVNSRIQGDTKLGRLMSDFSCADPDKYSCKVLSDRSGYLKDSAINLLKSTNLSPKEIYRILNIG